MNTTATESVEFMSSQVEENLKGTPYACTSLVKLSGGSANFVYRGTLATALDDGSLTVAIKHTEAYVANVPAFKLTSTRCHFEQTILAAMHTLPPSTHSGITVQSPHIYHFFPSSNTQVLRDLPSSMDLKTYAKTHDLMKSQCSRLGQSLGIWLNKFHAWGAAPEQHQVKETMRGNKEMMYLRQYLNYTTLITRIETFPEILGESKTIFKDIDNNIRQSLDNGEGTLIHGDFWSGNVIIPSGSLLSLETPVKLFVVDWELIQIGSIACDLGQMFAELFMLKHFKNIDAGFWLIESFLEGYGKVDEDIAFRTVIQTGAHFICWGAVVDGWGTKEQVEALVEIGRDFIVKGWQRDRDFFQNTALKCVFG